MKKLIELTYPKVAEELLNSNTLVLLPVGSIEEHGPHLPLFVDSLAAEELVSRAGTHLEEAGWNIVIAPTVPFGVTARTMDFPGNISVAATTLKELIKDVCRSLAHHGFATIIIINGHMAWEHVEALEEAKAELQEEVQSRITLFGFVRDMSRTAAVMAKGVRELLKSPAPQREGHSGEAETAVMLHTHPELVDQQILRTLPIAVDCDPREADLGTKSFKEVSQGGMGYFGSPSLATAELGQKILAIRSRNLADEILKVLRLSSSK